MNTPTHLVMTAALRRAMPQQSIPLSAALLGSIAPDLPLYFLTFGGMYYFTSVEGMTLQQAGRHIFGNLYFQANEFSRAIEAYERALRRLEDAGLVYPCTCSRKDGSKRILDTMYCSTTSLNSLLSRGL